MNQTEKPVTWVVYQTTIHGSPIQVNAVCRQSEWEAMARAPGHHTLVRAGIPSEGEAERLARGNSGDAPSSRRRRF